MDIFNLVLKALSVGLDALFPNIPIYPEDVPQNIPPRCFLTGFAGSPEVESEVGGRKRITGTLDISYLAPEHGNAIETRQELSRVFATLALNLTHMECQGITLLVRRHRRTDDGSEGTLHDLCEFVTFLLPVDKTPLMAEVGVKEGLKDG